MTGARKDPDKPILTVVEAGRIGGLKVRERHGLEHYKQIGAKGGRKVADERGPDYYSEIGKRACGTTPKTA